MDPGTEAGPGSATRTGTVAGMDGMKDQKMIVDTIKEAEETETRDGGDEVEVVEDGTVLVAIAIKATDTLDKCLT